MIFYQINVELQKIYAKQHEINSEIQDVSYVCEEVMDVEEKHDNRIIALEEEVKTIKAENNELRILVNSVVEELNAVITLLNTRYDVNN